MVIRVGDKIQKLNNQDTYKLMDIDDVEGASDIKNKVSSLEAGQQVLQNNIDQKLDGIHLEDIEGNAYDDIKAITFTGATVTDATEGDAHILITPKINVSNGQTPSSTSVEVEDLEFPGAVLTTRNSGKIAVVTQQATGSGTVTPITVDSTDYSSYDKIDMKDFSANMNGQTLELTPPASTGGGGSGIEIDDGDSDAAAITKLNIKGAKLTELPNQGSMGANEAEITAGVNIHMLAPNEQYGLGLANEITVLEPLSVYADPDTTDGVKLEIKPGTFEPMHSPSFLAYLTEDEEIVGKMGSGAKGHHDGALWFDNIIVPAGAYIETDKENKAYGLQEADELDPNVSGGTDYLVAFRAHMKGKAPNDGFVRAYLYDTNINPYEPTGIKKDINGDLMAVEKHYKKGDELGVIEVMGVVNAKGLDKFTCHVVDDFEDDFITLTDRTEGCTGLMIQALTSKEKTGRALLQFEADTQQNIEFSSHYLGVDRTSIDWAISQDIPVKTGAAGQGQTMTDGLHFYNINPMKMGVQSGYLLFQDDGSNICDFNFGKIFSAEETHMLRGKEVKFTTTLLDKDSGFNVALMKWTGKPDEYTPEIFESRLNTTPTFQTNWVKADDLFISEDVVSGDHVATKTFTVPDDANNYAVIIYPVQGQQPLTLKLKKFEVDVVTPFNGYVLHTSEKLDEIHLQYNDEYKELIQDNQGYASLRYTINANEIPMPIGELKKGSADITLDKSTNVIVGSGARGGEGAMVFQAEGKATISTDLLLWNEIAGDTIVRFNYYKERGGRADRIGESTGTFTVKAGANGVQYSMPTFTVDVETGDKIYLKAQSNHPDGCFLKSVTPSKPMLKTTVVFKELVADVGDDPFADLDLSQFDRVHTSQFTAVKEVQSASSTSIPLIVPSDMDVSVLSALKRNTDGSIRPVRSLDYSYKNNILNVSFGETVADAKIIIGVYI